MSLLDSGPHEVTVYPQVVTGKNKYGTWNTERGEGVVLTGVSVQPYGAGSMSGLESDDETSINDQKTVRGVLPWPGGVHSIIVFEGEEFDQIGLPKEYTQGVRTQHYMVRIKRRGTAVK